MLTLIIPPTELFDEETSRFIKVKGTTLQLEHSLVSVSKWEAKHHKIFLDNSYKKSNDEIIDYIKCMTLTQNVDPLVYVSLNQKAINDIQEYIQNPMTATHFNEDNIKKTAKKGPKQDEKMSSEMIYYYMVAAQIPFECQKWHLNRLLVLLRICGLKNQDPKKMSKSDLNSRYRSINAARRAAHKKP